MKYDKYAQKTIFSSKYCKIVDFGSDGTYAFQVSHFRITFGVANG